MKNFDEIIYEIKNFFERSWYWFFIIIIFSFIMGILTEGDINSGPYIILTASTLAVLITIYETKKDQKNIIEDNRRNLLIQLKYDKYKEGVDDFKTFFYVSRKIFNDLQAMERKNIVDKIFLDSNDFLLIQLVSFLNNKEFQRKLPISMQERVFKDLSPELKKPLENIGNNFHVNINDILEVVDYFDSCESIDINDYIEKDFVFITSYLKTLKELKLDLNNSEFRFALLKHKEYFNDLQIIIDTFDNIGKIVSENKIEDLIIEESN